MGKDYGKELFNIEVVKKGLFKKKVHYFKAFEKGLIIKRANNERYIDADSILNIYREDNVIAGRSWRVIVIYYVLESGEKFKYTIVDDEFPDIIEKVESLWDNEWKNYGQKYSETIKWILACTANVNMIWEVPYNHFGIPFDDDKKFKLIKDSLANDWDISNKQDLIEMCDYLYSGEYTNSCIEFYKNSSNGSISNERLKIKDDILNNKERYTYTYDLQRVILVSSLGYSNGYFTYEEALDYALNAAKKIQELHGSWDEFYKSYLLGYCFWSEQDADTADTNANKRKVIYEKTKKFPTHPWTISWNTELKRDW